MRVRQALADLERAIREDTECSFIGAGEGVAIDGLGRTVLLFQVPLSDQQVLALRQRVPEARALDTMRRAVS